MSSDGNALSVEGLGKCYLIYGKPADRLKQFAVPRLQRLVGRAPARYFREFWALRGVSFELPKASSLGHQEANLAAASVRLGDDEVAAITALGSNGGRLFDADPRHHEEL